MNTNRTNQEFTGIVVFSKKGSDIKLDCNSIFDMIVAVKQGIESPPPETDNVIQGVYAYIFSPGGKYVWSCEHFEHKEHWDDNDIFQLAFLFNRAFGLRGTITKQDDGTFDLRFKVKRRMVHVFFDIHNDAVQLIDVDDYITPSVRKWMRIGTYL